MLTAITSDALHKSRLLTVEERPFKRITKRLLDPGKSIISTLPTLPPTPPPDASLHDGSAVDNEAEQKPELDERQQWREDALLDFAAFESSIIRVQLLLTSNIKERERYAAEKLKIQATAQAVRDNTADLRIQLEEAQKTLALRKEYDELAEKITNNRLLRPREEQHANLDKLNAEIADLERESQEYTHTWVERRQQFGKIVEEGMQMRRLIRDEKEEVERREGMEEREDGDEDQRGRSSGAVTPRPDTGGTTPLHGTEKEHEDGSSGGLTVERAQIPRGRSSLQESQILENNKDSKTPGQEKEDEDMAEDGELSAESERVIAAPPEGVMALDEKEEGEQEENRSPAGGDSQDRMDVT